MMYLLFDKMGAFIYIHKHDTQLKVAIVDVIFFSCNNFFESQAPSFYPSNNVHVSSKKSHSSSRR